MWNFELFFVVFMIIIIVIAVVVTDIVGVVVSVVFIDEGYCWCIYVQCLKYVSASSNSTNRISISMSFKACIGKILQTCININIK